MWLGAVLAWLLAVPVVGRAQAVYDIVAAFDALSNHGKYPSAQLLQGSDGSFYGTTELGGAFGLGTVFKFDGTGTTNDSGTVFKLDTAGTLTTLHVFNYNDGASPYAGLIQGTDGSLYGTTSLRGRPFGGRTVFRLTTSGTLTILHSFNGIDGHAPTAGLIEATDGNLYGTAARGGPGQAGVVFRVRLVGASRSR